MMPSLQYFVVVDNIHFYYSDLIIAFFFQTQSLGLVQFLLHVTANPVYVKPYKASTADKQQPKALSAAMEQLCSLFVSFYCLGYCP